jgi:hypothetical protein
MPRVGLEPEIPVFERSKTVRILDRATTELGCDIFYLFISYRKKPNQDIPCIFKPSLISIVTVSKSFIKWKICNAKQPSVVFVGADLFWWPVTHAAKT